MNNKINTGKSNSSLLTSNNKTNSNNQTKMTITEKINNIEEIDFSIDDTVDSIKYKIDKMSDKISNTTEAFFDKTDDTIDSIQDMIKDKIDNISDKTDDVVKESKDKNSKFKIRDFDELNKNASGFFYNIGDWFSSLFSKKTKDVEVKKVEDEVKKEKTTYDLLYDTSTDVKKIFGKDTTIGVGGVKIIFDKVTKDNNGTIIYTKDGKVVKKITEEYVEIGDKRYYPDGTFSYKNSEASKVYYNENGIRTREEYILSGKKYITTYDENGNFLQRTENGVLTYEIKDGKEIYYDDDGNIEKEVEKIDDKTIIYNKKNNTKTIDYENGASETYDETGKLKIFEDENGYKTEYRYLKNGEMVTILEKNKDGKTVVTEYDINGKIRYQSIGKNAGTAPSSDGETRIPIISGDETRYDSNGNATPVVRKEENVTKRYYENGNLKEEVFDDGSRKSYHENGKIQNDSKSNGDYVSYSPDGKIYAKGENGVTSIYDTNGQLKEKYTYVNGEYKKLY